MKKYFVKESITDGSVVVIPFTSIECAYYDPNTSSVCIRTNSGEEHTFTTDPHTWQAYLACLGE